MLKGTVQPLRSLVVHRDGVEDMLDFDFEDGAVHLAENFDATFDIVTADNCILPCKASKDTKFRIYFPGEYTVTLLGYLKNGRPADQPPPVEPKAEPAPEPVAPKPAPQAAPPPARQPAPQPAPQPVAQPAAQPAPQPTPKPAPQPAPPPAPQPAPEPAPQPVPLATPQAPSSRPMTAAERLGGYKAKTQPPPAKVEPPPVPVVEPQAEPQVEPQVEPKFAEEAEVDVRDMTRCASLPHFMALDDLDQELADTNAEQVSDLQQSQSLGCSLMILSCCQIMRVALWTCYMVHLTSTCVCVVLVLDRWKMKEPPQSISDFKTFANGAV